MIATVNLVFIRMRFNSLPYKRRKTFCPLVLDSILIELNEVINMDQTKRYELSFRNPEVQVYAIIVLPAVLLSLLVIIFSRSGINFMYDALIQFVALMTFYYWRFIYRYKEKRKNNGWRFKKDVVRYYLSDTEEYPSPAEGIGLENRQGC